jgi:hypothetical protein
VRVIAAITESALGRFRHPASRDISASMHVIARILAQRAAGARAPLGASLR